MRADLFRPGSVRNWFPAGSNTALAPIPAAAAAANAKALCSPSPYATRDTRRVPCLQSELPEQAVTKLGGAGEGGVSHGSRSSGASADLH